MIVSLNYRLEDALAWLGRSDNQVSWIVLRETGLGTVYSIIYIYPVVWIKINVCGVQKSNSLHIHWRGCLEALKKKLSPVEEFPGTDISYKAVGDAGRQANGKG